MSKNPEDKRYILHLSDIHLGTAATAQNYRRRLRLDLTVLKVRKIDYLVVSGDLTNRATPEEYLAVFDMLNALKLDFDIESDHVIIAPGNHDLNWDASKQAYSPVPADEVPKTLDENGDYIPAPEGGASRRDEDKYRARFDNFAAFYKKVCDGKPYPTVYEDQAMLYPFEEDRILFLTLNSAWQIDHHWTKRASINMGALDKALGEAAQDKYDGWLKVAVWHHPVAGKETMNTEFLEPLSVAGFEVAMHGHIHEALADYYTYDTQRGLRIVGGGTFGAPAHEQVTGIPLQYNLIEFEPRKGRVTVRLRKKEKVDGAWSADARWGNKQKNPVSYRSFKLRHYSPGVIVADPPLNGPSGQNGQQKKRAPPPPPPPPPVNIIPTRWKAEWKFDDGSVYASDRVTFERWTEEGKGQFEGYGEVTYGDKEYKYPFAGEVSFGTRIVVLTYRAEKYPQEGNIGVACLELSNSATEMDGYWAGRAHIEANGRKIYTVRTGVVSMKKIKDLDK